MVSFHGILCGREMCILLPTDLKTYHNRYFIGTIFPTKIANFDNFAALAKIAQEFPNSDSVWKHCIVKIFWQYYNENI